MRRFAALAFSAGAVLSVAGAGLTSSTSAGLLDPPSDACTEVDSSTDPTCIAVGGAANLARQPCDYAFLPGCDLAAYMDPGYAVDSDPSPDGVFDWKVGAVHEHSGYSDGDIDSVPRDYWTAARTGVNASGTGVALDFLFSSEHSDNAQITPTTNATCLTDPTRTIDCGHFDDNTFWWKWPAALRQAQESTTSTFTAVRGFEWTNDFYNHLNVYFSRNYRNVKIDGSYLSMERMWEWLQQPVDQGGGADGLVTFNHPGSNPKLSPFDGSFPHAELLASTTLDNWNEVAYVPEVDDRVVGMEVNGGEDLAWFVKALRNGWHLSPYAAEDHHERSWADVNDHKTLVLTKGTTPQDYYWAVANRRTVAVHAERVGGTPGTPAVVPTIDLTADDRHVLGSRVPNGGGRHSLRVTASGLPAGSRIALIGSAHGLDAPLQMGTVGADGTFNKKHKVERSGSHWWFAIVCAPAASVDAVACGVDDPDDARGVDHGESVITAPIWFE